MASLPFPTTRAFTLVHTATATGAEPEPPGFSKVRPRYTTSHPGQSHLEAKTYRKRHENA